MKIAPLQAAFLALPLFSACFDSFAHDDVARREKEFNYGYRIGYITAVREAGEGVTMCTKNTSLLDAIQVIGTHNKSKGITPENVFTVKNITEALSAKYPCPKN